MGLHLVVPAGVGKELALAFRRAELGVTRAVHHKRHTGEQGSPGAHGARFQRYEQGAAFKPPVAQPGRCFSHCENFGVGSWITQGDLGVAAATNNLSVVYDDRSNRDLIFGR